MVSSTADTVTFSLVGFVVVVAAVVVWRIVGRDRTVRRFRFGFFYERDIDDRCELHYPEEPPYLDDEQHERLAREDERP